MQHFFAELRKKDGINYERDSLQMTLGGLDRFADDAKTS